MDMTDLQMAAHGWERQSDSASLLLIGHIKGAQLYCADSSFCGAFNGRHTGWQVTCSGKDTFHSLPRGIRVLLAVDGVHQLPQTEMPPIGLPVQDTKFTLDSAAVAGFFGGKEAISAMATVHLYRGRRWLGWFNSPGSYTIAKRFGRMANSRFWDGLFPGPNDSPAVSFGLDGKKGPEYIAALSGTHMKSTGHLAYLMMERSKELPEVKIGERQTKPCDVAYLAMKHVDYDAPVIRLPVRDALLGLIPIAASVTTCVMCALVYDWFSFSMILLGIVCSGLSSVVIGKGRLVIKSVNNPAKGCPPGHGILKGEEDVMVIKGKERDVNAITKGCFDLDMNPKRANKKQGDEEKNDKKQGGDKENGDKKQGNGKHPGPKGKGAVGNYHAIGFCSLLLLAQFLVQLLLIPQGHLFGQIMFLVSLVVSWIYNSYLSSLEKEKIQTDLLFETLGEPGMCRFRAGTRTTMAVFVCLLLFHEVKSDLPEEEQRRLRVNILSSCLPSDPIVWRIWTKKVVDQLIYMDVRKRELPYLRHEENPTVPVHELRPSQQGQAFPQQNPQLSKDNITLLNNLLDDAAAAFRGYFDVYETLPKDSSQLENVNGH